MATFAQLRSTLSSWFSAVRVESVTVPAAVWGTDGSAFCGGAATGPYAQMYRTQPAVRTVVDFLAENIAQLGLHAYRWLDATDRVRLQPTHPLSELLRRPNGRTTRYRLIRDLVQDVAVYGNAFLVKLGEREGSVQELLRVSPRALDVIAGADRPGVPAGYVWTWPDGGQRALTPADVIHFRLYHPESPLVGLSPLETLRRLLSEEQSALEYRNWFWQNGAKLSGWIGRPKDAPRWSEQQRAQFRDEWQQFHNAQNAGRTAVLEDGMEFTPVTATARDSQLLESRKLTREEVAAIYHVPPAMVGITEAQGYGSIREQHKVLYQDVLGPWLEMLTTELELQLVPDFGDAKDIYLEFQIAAKLQGSFEEQADALNAAVGSPWMTRNEARARQNLTRIDDPDFDTPITRLDVAQGQNALEAPPEPMTKAQPLPDAVSVLTPLYVSGPAAPPPSSGELDRVLGQVAHTLGRVDHALRVLPVDLAGRFPRRPRNQKTIRDEAGRIACIVDVDEDGTIARRRVFTRDAQGHVTEIAEDH